MDNAPGIVFQHKFSTTPGKPAGKLGLLLDAMFKNKFLVYLSLSCTGCAVDSGKWDR